MRRDTLTYSEAAAYLRVSTRTLRRLVAACEIGHMRFGRRVFFAEAHLDDFLLRHEIPVVRQAGRRRAS